MRLKFSKQRFAGDRTFQPGEVGEVDDEVAGQLIKEGSAAFSEEELTVFEPEPAAAPIQDPPQDPPKDPPAPKAKK